MLFSKIYKNTQQTYFITRRKFIISWLKTEIFFLFNIYNIQCNYMNSEWKPFTNKKDKSFSKVATQKSG